METPARSEYAMRRATVLASPQQCFDVALDLATYPEWAHAISEVTIDSVDDLGRPSTVTYVAEAIGRSTRYQLQYDLSQAAAMIGWLLVEGDIMARLDGAYTFADSVDEPGATDVTYELLDLLGCPAGLCQAPGRGQTHRLRPAPIQITGREHRSRRRLAARIPRFS
ncbi:MAG: hypothetical protein R2706_18265 [Acidimicrobiales bacterium]